MPNTSRYILPDAILQYQICTDCRKYLSYKPVKSYVSGEVKCGRCVKDGDGGYASSFEKVIEDVLFPCVNRFEGCTHLLKYEEVSEHEKTCIGNLYSCRICDGEKYQKISILHLINHYKNNHRRGFLPQPIFTIAQKEHEYYVYCDIKLSLCCMISVSLYDNVLQVDVIPLTNISLKYRLGIYTAQGVPDFNDKPVLLTNYKLSGRCREDLDLTAIIINKKSTKLYCKLEFDINVSVTKIYVTGSTDNIQREQPNKVKNMSVEEMTEIRKYTAIVKAFPKIYRDELFRAHFGQAYMRTYDFIEDTMSIKDKLSGKLIVVACSFCENFYAHSLEQRDIFVCEKVCTFTVCGQCYGRGVTKCSSCHIPLRRSLSDRHSYLYFYCKFACNKFFRGWELLEHEEKCEYNKYRFLSDKEYIQLYFGDENVKNSSFSKCNSIIYDNAKFSKLGRLYVVTRDNFRFILTFGSNGYRCNFQVCTRYDKNTHYCLIKVCERGEIREYKDTFYLHLDKVRTFFVVNIREKKKH